jgi:hypothetical protein
MMRRFDISPRCSTDAERAERRAVFFNGSQNLPTSYDASCPLRNQAIARSPVMTQRPRVRGRRGVIEQMRQFDGPRTERSLATPNTPKPIADGLGTKEVANAKVPEPLPAVWHNGKRRIREFIDLTTNAAPASCGAPQKIYPALSAHLFVRQKWCLTTVNS